MVSVLPERQIVQRVFKSADSANLFRLHHHRQKLHSRLNHRLLLDTLLHPGHPLLQFPLQSTFPDCRNSSILEHVALARFRNALAVTPEALLLEVVRANRSAHFGGIVQNTASSAKVHPGLALHRFRWEFVEAHSKLATPDLVHG
uniref:(northern house mosquito) hypothetical protein n=1 Tax=Culex pipiens TaxID=7175 RepID=A0A8D8JRL4_CULPI